MAASESFSNQNPPESSNHPADASPDSSTQRVPDSEGHVVVDSEVPHQEQVCTSKFCGVSGIEHLKGPYLHEGQMPSEQLRYRDLIPPWQKANPPPEVWDSWIHSFPTRAGPDRDNSGERSELYQRDVDRVDGFIAHHSMDLDTMIPDIVRPFFLQDIRIENMIPDRMLPGETHPALLLEFNQWRESWKEQREQGIPRPKHDRLEVISRHYVGAINMLYSYVWLLCLTSQVLAV